MIPAAFTSIGGFGHGVQRLLQILRDHASKVMMLNPRQTMALVRRAAREMSVAIQRGNAMMVATAGQVSARSLAS